MSIARQLIALTPISWLIMVGCLYDRGSSDNPSRHPEEIVYLYEEGLLPFRTRCVKIDEEDYEVLCSQLKRLQRRERSHKKMCRTEEYGFMGKSYSLAVPYCVDKSGSVSFSASGQLSRHNATADVESRKVIESLMHKYISALTTNDASLLQLQQKVELQPSNFVFLNVDKRRGSYAFFGGGCLRNIGQNAFNIVDIVGTNRFVGIHLSNLNVPTNSQVDISLSINLSSYDSVFSGTVFLHTDLSNNLAIPIHYYGRIVGNNDE